MIEWKNVQIRIRTSVIINNLQFTLKNGESIGIIGSNGTGKTILAKAIAGLLPINGEFSETQNLNTVYVSFQTNIKLNNGFTAYRQQRWNNIDPNSAPKVREYINFNESEHILNPLLDKFDMRQHLNSHVISLSNGELRKLELIKALAKSPQLLVIDNAFNGLDALSRQLLTEMIDKLVEEGHSIVLTGINVADFPPSIKRFVKLSKDEHPTVFGRNEIIETDKHHKPEVIPLPKWENSTIEELISVNNITLTYNEKAILRNVSWQVKAGEHWVLSGRNGAGKTSLLNLIFADNPKAYLFDIKLFGKQRGSGESIWDIKKQIGFISPELQQYLPQNQHALEVICSGLFDSEGLYTKPTSYQLGLARHWLNSYGKTEWTNRKYGELSASEQRIVLILRTVIKNPPLLLLDEPFQGLDQQNIERLKLLFEQIAQQTNCAMVFVTHLPTEIPSSFRHELKLHKGEVVFCGKRD